jgi:hypothetical protein
MSVLTVGLPFPESSAFTVRKATAANSAGLRPVVLCASLVFEVNQLGAF